ncbi:hypothetical protein BC835DRAFT_473462 [Cytidiella melzeri]|nr:hypothetical protein BC835DRAFT_473462 [Cytidiella melzeri]
MCAIVFAVDPIVSALNESRWIRIATSKLDRRVESDDCSLNCKLSATCRSVTPCNYPRRKLCSHSTMNSLECTLSESILASTFFYCGPVLNQAGGTEGRFIANLAPGCYLHVPRQGSLVTSKLKCARQQKTSGRRCDTSNVLRLQAVGRIQKTDKRHGHRTLDSASEGRFTPQQ